MSKNVIDCALTGIIAAADVKWYDTCTWAYLIPMSASGDIVMINTELLNSLPEEIQTIILEEADNLTKANEEFAATSVDSAIEELEANGCEVVFPTEEEVAEMTELAKATGISGYRTTIRTPRTASPRSAPRSANERGERLIQCGCSAPPRAVRSSPLFNLP